MGHSSLDPAFQEPRPWNDGRLMGAKRALKPQQVWAIRFWPDQHRRLRDRALFDLAIDSKLRGCDVVKIRIGDVVAGGHIRDRAIVVQQKTKRPVQFEIVEPRDVTHKGHVYPGEHDAIVDRALWDQVQAIAADNRVTRRLGSRAKAPSLLTGLIADRNGRPMSPTYAVHYARRYRYYATRPSTSGRSAKGDIVLLPAYEIETLVVARLVEWLEADTADSAISDITVYRDLRAQRGAIADQFRTGGQTQQRIAILDLGVAVTVGDDRVEIGIGGNGSSVQPAIIVASHRRCDPRADLRLAIAGNGGPVNASPDAALLKLIVLGFAAREAAISGKAEPLVDHDSRQHQTRLARLSYLAPNIIAAIAAGRQPPALSGRRLLRIADLPLAWTAQREAFGFA